MVKAKFKNANFFCKNGVLKEKSLDDLTHIEIATLYKCCSMKNMALTVDEIHDKILSA